MLLPIVVSILFLFYLMYSGNYLQCPVYGSTGIPCGTCGVTRDFKSLLQLDKGIWLNPMSPWLFAWIGVQVTYRFLLVTVFRSSDIASSLPWLDGIVTAVSIVGLCVGFYHL